jgi:hypothetical protein
MVTMAMPGAARAPEQEQHTGRVITSAIQFHTDLASMNGLVVPLGAMVEVVLPKIRGLGMIARTELQADELKAIGELGRRLVEKPFEYLCGQFTEAWVHTAPGDALVFLAAKHPNALHFSVPCEAGLPRTVAPAEAEPALRNVVRTFLGQRLDEEMIQLITVYHLRSAPQQDLVRLQSAA